MTTMSAPFGTGAPVMIRLHVPGVTVFLGTVPAAIVSITGSCLSRSSARQAKPSIAERSREGISTSEVISEASTLPRASERGTRSEASGGAAESTVSNAFAKVSTDDFFICFPFFLPGTLLETSQLTFPYFYTQIIADGTDFFEGNTLFL